MGKYWDTNGRVIAKQDHGISGLGTFMYTYSNNRIKDNDVSAHYHRNSIEFSIVLEGTYEFHLNDEVLLTNQGDMVIAFPNQMHRYSCIDEVKGRLVSFHIDLSSNNIFDLQTQQSDELKTMLTSIDVNYVSIGEDNLALMLDCVEHMIQINSTDFLIAKNLMVAFIFKIIKEIGCSGACNGDISQVIKYINKHIYDDLSLVRLSEISGLSVSRFKHKFKEVTGETPNDYIVKQKIFFAKKLLVTNTISDVANSLKFSSANYFTVVFKKYTGTTPSKFKQSMGIDEE